LDPIATGVLITGVGRGTKELGRFLECSKTYETVVLFGVATDSYDCVGKVTTRAPYEHVTREAVEKALEQFRGQIMQKPSMFSALKVKGKKLYEYAREGKEPPIEIAKRPVEVHNLEIMDWYEGGTHEYKWPEEEAEENVKMVAEKLLHKELGSASPATDVAGDQHAQKRKSSPELTSETGQETTEQPPLKRTRTDQDDSTPAAAEAEPATASKPPAPPAVKLRMTVSSGFYVRSLAHDLGLALGSNAIMSSLVRKRQGDFDISPENILEYKDLDGGEEVWGPKLQGFLDKWVSREAARKEQEKEEDVRDAERRFRRNTSSDEG
jgi:tRNA pseudouridine55 synthase